MGMRDDRQELRPLKRSKDIAARKADHVDIVLAGDGCQTRLSTGFDEVRFAHAALPELSMESISLTASFLGRPLLAPLLISSMTGGHAKGADINLRLAEAAQARGIALAVGSQRVAIEGGSNDGLDRNLRRVAPGIPIYANFGGAQLRQGYGLDEARRAIEVIEADALIVHLNPLQEAVQTGGDRDWSGVLQAIDRLARRLERPLIVKEVGFGLSGTMVRKLAQCGVAAVDVAGAGGTNWALVEASRTGTERAHAVASAFADWGIPTAEAIMAARSACPDLPLIGSGGVRTGVDVAKAIRLGADLVGIAAGLLQAATQSASAVDAALGIVIEQLRLACFCTGSPTLDDLRQSELLQRSANSV